MYDELVLYLIPMLMSLLVFHPLCGLKSRGSKGKTLRPHNQRIAESEWSQPSALPSPPKRTATTGTSEVASKSDFPALSSTQPSGDDPTSSHTTNTGDKERKLKEKSRDTSKGSSSAIVELKVDKTQQSIENKVPRFDKTQLASREPFISPEQDPSGCHREARREQTPRFDKTQLASKEPVITPGKDSSGYQQGAKRNEAPHFDRTQLASNEPVITPGKDSSGCHQEAKQDHVPRFDKTQLASNEPLIKPGKDSAGKERQDEFPRFNKTQTASNEPVLPPRKDPIEWYWETKHSNTNVGKKQSKPNCGKKSTSHEDFRTVFDQYNEVNPNVQQEKGRKPAPRIVLKDQKKKGSVEKVEDVTAISSIPQSAVSKQTRRDPTCVTQDELGEHINKTQIVAQDNYTMGIMKEDRPIAKSKS